MTRTTLTVALPAIFAASFCISDASFAQPGGNGQGGLGAGNAHGAATSGPTYQGDPVVSPLDRMPGKSSKTNYKDDMSRPDSQFIPNKPEPNPPTNTQ
jgi:hypothetical protein